MNASNIKFIHHRPFVTKRNPKHLHILDKIYHNQVTIGYMAVKDSPDIIVAFAKCNSKDNYCKKIGRAIVTGRIKSGDCHVIRLGNDKQTVNSRVRQWAEVKGLINV